jgi:hypothetical protein
MKVYKIVDSNVLITMFTLKSPMIIVGQTVRIFFFKFNVEAKCCIVILGGL